MPKQLKTIQTNQVAEKIMDWGNLVFIGLVVAQIVPGPGFNWLIAIAGVITFAGAYFIAIRLMKGGR